MSFILTKQAKRDGWNLTSDPLAKQIVIPEDIIVEVVGMDSEGFLQKSYCSGEELLFDMNFLSPDYLAFRFVGDGEADDLFEETK